MSVQTPAALPTDPFEELLPQDVQQQAARLVHEAFAAALRLSAHGEGKQLEEALSKLACHLREWARMSTQDAAHLRLALVLNGLDQWGLAYGKAFGASALAGLSTVLADLRDALAPSEEAACQHWLDALTAQEHGAREFKIEFRRELHLSLWHTLLAASEREEAEGLLHLLGGMLLAIPKAMPTLGWRIVADALASIQIRCLQHGLAAEGLAREMTEELFSALNRELPEAVRSLVTEHSAVAVRAWQEAQRETRH